MDPVKEETLAERAARKRGIPADRVQFGSKKHLMSDNPTYEALAATIRRS
jgi:hypothetical protein